MVIFFMVAKLKFIRKKLVFEQNKMPYPAAYISQRKPMFLIGISFSAASRNGSDYKFELIND